MMRKQIWVGLAFMAVGLIQSVLAARIHSDETIVEKTSLPARFVRTGPGDYFADFGLDWFAQLHLRIDSPRSGAVVGVSVGERAIGGRVNPHPGGYVTYYHTQLRLLRGLHSYNVPLPKSDARRMPASIGAVMPFRYAQISGCPSPLHSDDVLQVRVHNRFNRKIATFTSSNKTLNAVWKLCHHSIEETSFCGVFADGNRERRPYEADDLIAELDWFNNTTGSNLPTATDRYLIYHPTWPTEWIMQSVLMAWYDYLYTGNPQLIRNNYTALKAKTLVALERPDGLISTVKPPVPKAVLKSIYRTRPIRDIVDWPPDQRDGYVFKPINTVVNAFHYRSMVLMARMAAVLGHHHDARFFARRALLIRQAMNRLLINPSTGLYVDGIGTNHSSEQANLFPLAFGIPPKKDQARIADFLVRQGMKCSVYGAQYLLPALYRAQKGQAALNLLASTSRHSWMHMIAEGSTVTTEAWTFRSKPNEDWNHVWGSAPANIIPRYLMGVRPLSPGFHRALIEPQPGDLAFARITVPTIHGVIRESWRHQGKNIQLRVKIPNGIDAVLRLPAVTVKSMQIHLDGAIAKPTFIGHWAEIGSLKAGQHSLAVEPRG